MTGKRRIGPTPGGIPASRGLVAAVGSMRLLQLMLVAVAAACAVLAFPALASADDFCVGAPAGCAGTPVAPSGLAAALTAAQSNGSDDRFLLAPGLYANGPLSYNSPEKLELIGVGESTQLRSSSPGPVFTLGGNPASTISNLNVVPSGNGTRGLALVGTRAEGATVEVEAGISIDVALTLSDGASFSRGLVKLTQNAIGVGIADGGSLTDSSIKAPNGAAIFAAGSDMTVRRSTLRAKFGAVVGGGHLAMSDTLIDIGKFGEAGVRANTSFSGAGPTVAELDRLTIVGSTSFGTRGGVVAEANGAGKSASIHLRDSVIRGVNPLVRLGTNGGVANISTDRSNYPNSATGSDMGPGSLVEERRLNVDPRFVDPAGGDFHLAADSPLIDAGTPGGLPADATFDLDGQPRASDGDGDCTHVPDIGAFELQGTKVTALATAGAASAQAGQPVSFSSAGSCIPGPGEPQAAWSFDDGAGATGAAVEHAFATPGQHTATLTIGDGAGHQASASATVEVTAAPAGAAGPAAPVLSKLKLSPGRIAIGKLLPKLVAKPAKRPAATISFTLSKAAKVELRFAKLGTSGKLRRLKPKLRVAAKRGVNRVRFAGRLSRKVRLAPGAYRLTAVATDAAGARSAPTSKRFTVIKTR